MYSAHPKLPHYTTNPLPWPNPYLAIRDPSTLSKVSDAKFSNNLQIIKNIDKVAWNKLLTNWVLQFFWLMINFKLVKQNEVFYIMRDTLQGSNINISLPYSLKTNKLKMLLPPCIVHLIPYGLWVFLVRGEWEEFPHQPDILSSPTFVSPLKPFFPLH